MMMQSITQCNAPHSYSYALNRCGTTLHLVVALLMVKLGALQRIRFHFIISNINILRRLEIMSIVWLSNGGVLYLLCY